MRAWRACCVCVWLLGVAGSGAAVAASAEERAAALLGLYFEADPLPVRVWLLAETRLEYRLSDLGDGRTEVVLPRVSGAALAPRYELDGAVLQGVRIEVAEHQGAASTRLLFEHAATAAAVAEPSPEGLQVRFVERPAAAGEGVSPRPSLAARLVEGARLSVERAPRYDASYRELAFPGGDPGWQRGCGADLLVRAFRQAGVDLQQAVFDDLSAHPEVYGIERPDPNIDHRRLRNLVLLLERRTDVVKVDPAAGWQPGDVVLWARDGGARANHVGIVTDRMDAAGRPWVVHHLPDGSPIEDDALERWPVRAQLRLVPSTE